MAETPFTTKKRDRTRSSPPKNKSSDRLLYGREDYFEKDDLLGEFASLCFTRVDRMWARHGLKFLMTAPNTFSDEFSSQERDAFYVTLLLASLFYRAGYVGFDMNWLAGKTAQEWMLHARRWGLPYTEKMIAWEQERFRLVQSYWGLPVWNAAKMRTVESLSNADAVTYRLPSQSFWMDTLVHVITWQKTYQFPSHQSPFIAELPVSEPVRVTAASSHEMLTALPAAALFFKNKRWVYMGKKYRQTREQIAWLGKRMPIKNDSIRKYKTNTLENFKLRAFDACLEIFKALSTTWNSPNTYKNLRSEGYSQRLCETSARTQRVLAREVSANADLKRWWGGAARILFVETRSDEEKIAFILWLIIIEAYEYASRGAGGVVNGLSGLSAPSLLYLTAKEHYAQASGLVLSGVLTLLGCQSKQVSDSHDLNLSRLESLLGRSLEEFFKEIPLNPPCALHDFIGMLSRSGFYNVLTAPRDKSLISLNSTIVLEDYGAMKGSLLKEFLAEVPARTRIVFIKTAYECHANSEHSLEWAAWGEMLKTQAALIKEQKRENTQPTQPTQPISTLHPTYNNNNKTLAQYLASSIYVELGGDYSYEKLENEATVSHTSYAVTSMSYWEEYLRRLIKDHERLLAAKNNSVVRSNDKKTSTLLSASSEDAATKVDSLGSLEAYERACVKFYRELEKQCSLQSSSHSLCLLPYASSDQLHGLIYKTIVVTWETHFKNFALEHYSTNTATVHAKLASAKADLYPPAVLFTPFSKGAFSYHRLNQFIEASLVAQMSLPRSAYDDKAKLGQFLGYPLRPVKIKEAYMKNAFYKGERGVLIPRDSLASQPRSHVTGAYTENYKLRWEKESWLSVSKSLPPSPAAAIPPSLAVVDKDFSRDDEYISNVKAVAMANNLKKTYNQYSNAYAMLLAGSKRCAQLLSPAYALSFREAYPERNWRVVAGLIAFPPNLAALDLAAQPSSYDKIIVGDRPIYDHLLHSTAYLISPYTLLKMLHLTEEKLYLFMNEHTFIKIMTQSLKNPTPASKVSNLADFSYEGT
ncbi:hypothetical protein COTS27_00118 [Spirochaetota bacterium]|nr:hypothetical protein COTS27_00118 [Spirochaetota bacterium]